jgi:hypothetical protein
LAAVAGLQPAYGWDEAVFRLCSAEQATYYLDPGRRVACMPLRQPIARADDLMVQASAQQWLARLRSQCQLIVLDAGSVWEAGSKWASWADVALVVCDSGRTLADEWARAWDRLEESGTHVLGIIETFV